MVYVSINELEMTKKRDLKSEKVILGMIFDEYYLPEMNRENPYHVKESVLKEIANYLKNIDVHIYPIFVKDFSELIPISQKINGLLILGGRDINPIEYNESNFQSHVFVDTNLRFNLVRTLLRLAPVSLPVFGICAGYQMLNIIHGGSLIQDQGEDINHQHKKFAENQIFFTENTWLYQFGPEVNCVCNHHQNVKNIADNWMVNAHSFDGYIHGLELINDQEFKLGVLWHPERSLLS